jgi:cytoskeletal protein CcmA (bactofilin family)/ribosomal protein S27E
MRGRLIFFTMAAKSARHRLDVTCPECGHTQSEPSAAVSTVCRSCGVNFKIESGKAVPRAKPAAVPSRPSTLDAEIEEQHLVSKPVMPFKRSEPAPPPPIHPLLRFFIKPPQPREVLCKCGRTHFAAPAAQSAQCPGCGAYISLRDYEIVDRWNRRIETRGNVLVAKGGALTGVPVICHNLTVLGELSAPVECSGDLVIRHTGRVPGTVTCRTLRVERGAKVEFLHTVHAQEVFIDGHVTGHIRCTGTLTLEKRVVLHGLVQAARLVAQKGARHNGSMEILSPGDSV